MKKKYPNRVIRPADVVGILAVLGSVALYIADPLAEPEKEKAASPPQSRSEKIIRGEQERSDNLARESTSERSR